MRRGPIVRCFVSGALATLIFIHANPAFAANPSDIQLIPDNSYSQYSITLDWRPYCSPGNANTLRWFKGDDTLISVSHGFNCATGHGNSLSPQIPGAINLWGGYPSSILPATLPHQNVPFFGPDGDFYFTLTSGFSGYSTTSLSNPATISILPDPVWNGFSQFDLSTGWQTYCTPGNTNILRWYTGDGILRSIEAGYDCALGHGNSTSAHIPGAIYLWNYGSAQMPNTLPHNPLAVFFGPEGDFYITLTNGDNAVTRYDWTWNTTTTVIHFDWGWHNGTYTFPGVATSSEPICIEECFDNVLFIPGIKGSVLKLGSDTLWPPSILSNDLPQLALDTSGHSVNDVRVDGILNTFYGKEIYQPFSDFMDQQVASGVIHEWLPLGYDWRYSPEHVAEKGIVGTGGNIDIVEQIGKLASTSKSGKVTIVAHSMGGLVGKAIIKRLEAEGKANLIGSFIMVGSPQLGTPQAIPALLHGDGEDIGFGFIVNPAHARALSQNLPGAYALLPSPTYFSVVSDPVITFDPNASFTDPWRAYWTDSINSYSKFLEFVTGQGVPRTKPNPFLLRLPEVLNTDLVTGAANFHNEYDAYQLPNTIRTIQIAGWGRPTTKGVEYTENHRQQSYETSITREGDTTVVQTSATSQTDGEKYFFNLFEQNKLLGNDTKHFDLLSADSVQTIVHNFLTKNSVENINFISASKPNLESLDDLVIVSTHSPVILGAYDQYGNFTGISPEQDLSSPILAVTENIPGSSFTSTNETQSIFLPKNGTYRFVYKGIGNGPTTVTVDQMSTDIVTPIIQYSDIPTATSTSASFNLSADAPEKTVIEVDVDGNGSKDQTITPDGTILTLAELVVKIKQQVLSLNITEKLKQNLLKKIEALEKKIASKKQKNLKALSALESKIATQVLKGNVTQVDAASIATIVDTLETQTDNLRLDPKILAELKEKVQGMNIKPSIKTDLLKKLTKIENKQSLTAKVAVLVSELNKKADLGNMSEIDAQSLIGLLTQIENAL